MHVFGKVTVAVWCCLGMHIATLVQDPPCLCSQQCHCINKLSCMLLTQPAVVSALLRVIHDLFCQQW